MNGTTKVVSRIKSAVNQIASLPIRYLLSTKSRIIPNDPLQYQKLTWNSLLVVKQRLGILFRQKTLVSSVISTLSAYVDLTRLGVFLLPLDGILVHCRLRKRLASTHLMPGRRETLRVKCLPLEHETITRAQGSNRESSGLQQQPFRSSGLPLSQNECSCKTFQMKMS